MRIESNRVSPFVSRRRARIADLVAGDAENLAGRHERQKRPRRGLREVQHRPLVGQQVDQKILPRAALGEHADHVRDAGQLFQQRHRELPGENDVANPLAPLELRHFHPHRALQTRFVEQQVAFVLRLGALHGGGGGHVAPILPCRGFVLRCYRTRFARSSRGRSSAPQSLRVAAELPTNDLRRMPQSATRHRT